jgi:hypothetical protein
MSLLTDRQLSVIDGDKWCGWGWGRKLNHQTPQYDSRFETHEGCVGRRDSVKGWPSDTITSTKASDVPQKKKVSTVFSFNDTLEDFQQFLKSFSCGPRLSAVKLFCAVWGRGEVCTGFFWGSLREGDHWGDPDVDGRIILRGILRKWEGVVGTGWSGLRLGTVGGHL